MDITEFIRGLFQVVGNKRYMSDIEQLFKTKLSEISPKDKQSLRYLIQDLKRLQADANKPKFNFMRR